MQGRGAVPKSWLSCPRDGVGLILGKFLAVKTPLCDGFDNRLAPEERFYPEDLFDKAKHNSVKFGLWVDLTNTERYYDKQSVKNEGCEYFKLTCSGHGDCPTTIQIQTFINKVHSFICKHPNEAILVHCTHGFNRTGYLIVSFMVEKLKFKVVDALKEFAQMRPPGIYRREYVDNLIYKYGTPGAFFKTPEMPLWVDQTHEKKLNAKRRR